MDPREELKAFLDGELDLELAGQVQSALEADPDLAKEADQYRALSAAFKEEHAVEPVGLEKTLAALNRRNRPWWKTPRLLIPSAVAGALGIALVTAFGRFILGPSDRIPFTAVGVLVNQKQSAASPAESARVSSSAGAVAMAKKGSDSSGFGFGGKLKAPEFRSSQQSFTRSHEGQDAHYYFAKADDLERVKARISLAYPGVLHDNGTGRHPSYIPIPWTQRSRHAVDRALAGVPHALAKSKQNSFDLWIHFFPVKK